MKPSPLPPDLAGKRVTVMGLGSFGGGVGVARFLAARGAVVTVTDVKPAGELQESVDALEGLRLVFHLDGHRREDFEETELVVASPAVRPDSEYLEVARHLGIPVTTEMSIFFALCRSPIVGITGSSGKTTTTSLIGAMLKRKDPRTLVGGNIGRSLLDCVETIPDDVPVVLELSSFQLQALAETGRSPELAVITNLAPNHLDRHASMDEYVDAKKVIVESQRPNDAAVLNADDARVAGLESICPGRVVFFSRLRSVENGACLRNGSIWARGLNICRLDELLLPGRHNVENALAAAAAAIDYGVSGDAVAEVLRTFTGVEHRLELVGRARGVAYYNDSKATTPESTIAALDALEDHGIVLIAGGYDKGAPFGAMARTVAAKARKAVLIGKTAGKMESLIKQEDSAFPIARSDSLEQAVALAMDSAVPGDVVLLSPGCASYDMFRNYEERGRKFKEIVTGAALSSS